MYLSMWIHHISVSCFVLNCFNSIFDHDCETTYYKANGIKVHQISIACSNVLHPTFQQIVLSKLKYGITIS